MQYTSVYQSPIGEILLSCDESGLTGLWFEGAKFYARGLAKEHEMRETPVLAEAKQWLGLYFSGQEPGFMPPIHMIGSPFQLSVWKCLLQIPYGKTTTYGKIAERIAAERGAAHMSAQAVGGAVGRNRISIIIPCHRVVGINGGLTGYAGGVEKKLWLLTREGAAPDGLSVPAEEAAL